MQDPNRKLCGIVDNFCTHVAGQGMLFGVHHFGTMLRRLRSERGLTQQTLADSARLSEATVRKAEKSRECPWHKSSAIEVFKALDRAGPLTQAEADLYFSLTKMPALNPVHRREETPRPLARLAEALDSPSSPEEQTAHNYIGRMIEEVGAVRTLTALETIAAMWNIDLPPRLRESEVARTGRWVLMVDDRIEDRHRVRIFAPVQPTPAVKPVAKNKRSA